MNSTFKIYNPYDQIIDNQIILQDKKNTLNFVEFSIQDNDGNHFFLGRGLGYTGAAYTGRYKVEKDIKIEYAIIYFDNSAIQNWGAGQTCGFILYREDPDYGVDPLSHPPCVAALAGTGENAFPGGGINNWHFIQRSVVYCINHGRDPRNNVTGPLIRRAYTIIQIGVDCAEGSSLSLRMDPNDVGGAGWTNADITVELYYTQL